MGKESSLDIPKEDRQSEIIEFVDLATAAQGLCDLQQEITDTKAVNRTIASAVESLSEGTLSKHCKIASYTERHSLTNLTITVESIADRVVEILSKLFKMAADLFRKVISITTAIYDKIRGREQLYEKELADNTNYRKANSDLFASLDDGAQKEVKDHAAEVDAGISKTIESSYTKLFHAFLEKGDVYKAHVALSPLFKPYIEYLNKRLHAYIDLSYQMARFTSEEQVAKLSEVTTALKDAKFDQGLPFINACTRLELEVDPKADLTFSSSLYGFRLLLKKLKKEQGEKPPTYKEFSTAKLWQLTYEGGIDINKLLAELDGLAKKMDAIKPNGSEIDKSLLSLYTSTGVVIRNEIHTVLDLSAIASEVMGVRLIAMRLEAQKARAMYDLIKAKAKADAVAKAEALVKGKTE